MELAWTDEPGTALQADGTRHSEKEIAMIYNSKYLFKMRIGDCHMS
jgi:hypothetical protein